MTAGLQRRAAVGVFYFFTHGIKTSIRGLKAKYLFFLLLFSFFLDINSLFALICLH